jgi:beta-glucosidase
MKFQGYVVSDQGAIHDPSEAIKAGCDLEDGFGKYSQLGDLVKAGNVSENDDIDVALRRLFYVRMRQGEFDPPAQVPYADASKYGIGHWKQTVSATYTRVSLEAARQSIALLHNVDRTLPLVPKQKQKVAIFGCLVREKRVGLGGAVYSDCAAAATAGYNSGAGYDEHDHELPPITTVSPTEALVAQGIDATFVNVTMSGGMFAHPSAARKVASAAEGADVAVLFLGRAGAEGESGSWCKTRECGDTPDMKLSSEQAALLAAVRAQTSTPIVIVLFNCNPLEFVEEALAPTAASSGSSPSPSPLAPVKAIVHAFYPQLWAGTAVADVLTGAFPPAGRMPYSWPRKAGLVDYGEIGDYRMGGTSKTYRYTSTSTSAQGKTKTKTPSLFPFGFGLSYSKFTYSNLAVVKSIKTCNDVSVSVTVRNDGAVDSDEVVQVYASWAPSKGTARTAAAPLPLPLSTPQLQLVAFDRVHIKAGASMVVRLRVGTLQLALAVHEAKDPLPHWVSSPVNVALSVGGQQPRQQTAAPSNVLQVALAIEGEATPVDLC